MTRGRRAGALAPAPMTRAGAATRRRALQTTEDTPVSAEARAEA
jgi:hypothetical protein